MPKYYDRIIQVPWDEDAIIFTRTQAQSPLFSVRIKRKSSKRGYYVEALKTSIESVALDRAKTVIKKVRLAEFAGFDLSQRTFASLWPAFIGDLPSSTSKDRLTQSRRLALTS